MYFISDGRTIFSFEYPVRSNTSTPFRQVVITSDDAFLAVPAADKGNRDCIIIYSAKTGALISKIPIKLPGFRVIIIYKRADFYQKRDHF